MGFDALKGLEKLGKPKPKIKPKTVPPKQEVLPPEPEFEIGEPAVVRTPRVIPAAKAKAVNRVKAAEEEQGGVIAANPSRMGASVVTQARRQEVLAWMLNGHLYDGKLMSVQQLAAALEVPVRTIERDVATLKESMAQYHTESDEKDIPALAYMLMEMKFQDRGRALALYNIIMSDIKEADAATHAWEQESGKPSKYGLTGRDRAAMYNAALQAMDLANKATNGMDSLFKMTGGAQKLQNIIKAKQLIINKGQMVVGMGELHEFVGKELGGVLPSVRQQNPQLQAPSALEITADDEQIMAIADKERKGK